MNNEFNNKKTLLYRAIQLAEGNSVILSKALKKRIDNILGRLEKKAQRKTYEKAYVLASAILQKNVEVDGAQGEYSKALSVDHYIKRIFKDKFYKEVFLMLSAPEPNSTMGRKPRKENSVSFKEAVFQSDGEPREGKSMLFRINPILLRGKYIRVDLDKFELPNSFNSLYKKQLVHFYKTSFQLYLDKTALVNNLELELEPTLILKGEYYAFERSFDDVMNHLDVHLNKKKFSKIRKEGKLLLVEKNSPKPFAYIKAIRDNHNLSSKHQLDIIIEGDVAHIANQEDFLKEKRRILTEDLMQKVDRIKDGLFFASISESNGRKHSDFTGLNNIAIKYLRFGGPYGDFLGSLDLRSSQPTILANLLLKDPVFIDSISQSRNKKMKDYLDVFHSVEIDNTADIYGFLESCTSYEREEGFYERLAGTIEIKNKEGNVIDYSAEDKRQYAKLEMMRVLFSGPGYNSHVIKIDDEFPGLSKVIRSVKKAFAEKYNDDKNHFTLFLQLVEGYIFIERIYERLAELDIPSLSKHDSILFSRTAGVFDKDEHGDLYYNPKEMIDIIHNIFNEINFKGTLKATAHLYMDSKSGHFTGFDSFIQYPSMCSVGADGKKIKPLYGSFN